MSFNLAIVEGRLGKDVESRATANGKKVVNFSVASDYGYKDNAGTQWDNVVCWGADADFAEKYLKKGSSVLIVGERRTRSWDANGEKKYVTELHTFKVSFAGSKSDSESTEKGQSQKARSTVPAQIRAQTAPATRVQSDDPFGDGTGIGEDDVPW